MNISRMTKKRIYVNTVGYRSTINWLVSVATEGSKCHAEITGRRSVDANQNTHSLEM